MNVNLTPRGERLLREHLSRGNFRSPEEVIEHALQILTEQEDVTARSSTAREQSPQEFEAFLDALAAYSDQIPSMPGETFSREMIYQDHD